MGILLTAFLLTDPIQTVMPFTGEASSERYSSLLPKRALGDAFDKALDYLSRETGLLLTDRERKRLIHHLPAFVVRKVVHKNGFNGAVYLYSADFFLDLSSVIREITRGRHHIPKPAITVYAKGLDRTGMSDLQRLFPSLLYDVSFVYNPHGRIRCPRKRVCISVDIRKDGERVMLEYAVWRRKQKPHKIQIASMSQSMALSALPDEIIKLLSPVSMRELRVDVTGLADGFQVLRFLEVLRRQKGSLFSVYSYTIDGGVLHLKLRVPEGIGLQAIFMGLYLGDGVRTSLEQGTIPGTWLFRVVMPRQSEETGNEGE